MSNAHQDLTEGVIAPDGYILVPHEPSSRRQRAPRDRRVVIRKLIGIGILTAMAGGIAYVLLGTDLVTPYIETYVPMVTDAIAWVREDPSRLMGAAAAFVITHMGILQLLFGDERQR